MSHSDQNPAIERLLGQAAVTARIGVTDVRTAQRLARTGARYVWELAGGRLTGRCIVTIYQEPGDA